MPDAHPSTAASGASFSDAWMEGWMVRFCYGWQLVGFLLLEDGYGKRVGWLVVGNLFLAA